MKKFLLLVMLNLFQHPCFSQDHHLIDSLQNELRLYNKNSKGAIGISISDSTKVYILLALSRSYYQLNTDTALEKAVHALSLSEQIGFKKGAAQANAHAGYLNKLKGNYAQAFNYYGKAMLLFKEANNEAGLGNLYYSLGCLSQDEGNFPQAIKYYLDGMALGEKTGDKTHTARCNNNIGSIYEELGNYTDALNIYNANLTLQEELKDKEGIAGTYLNIGAVYNTQGDYIQAMKFILLGLKAYEEIGSKYGVANSHNSIGVVYNKIGNYSEAIKNQLIALKLHNAIGYKYEIANTLIAIGKTYEMQGNLRQALNYESQARSMANEIGAKDYLRDAYQNLSNINVKMGNFQEAYRNYVLFKQMSDSIFNKENTKKLTQTQMQYGFDKKDAATKAEQEKKDALAQKELQKQKLVRNGFVGGFTVVLLFAGVFFMQRNRIKKGNAALQAAKERAEQSEKFKQQFLANMSHEIRTPMNAVMGMTNLVLETPLTAKQKFYLEGVSKSSDNLLHIINDILDLSKIEAGKIELEKIDFSIHEAVNGVKQILHHKAEEKGLHLITDIDSTIPDVVIGDPVRLNQVLINLTGNAIKFTEKGSVTIEVSPIPSFTNVEGVASMQETPPLGEVRVGLRFSIVDTGIGIPKEKLQTVFESFSQAHASDTRKFGGTGLGLSISKQLVELMGGKILVESEEGAGTAFSFEIILPVGSQKRLDEQKTSEAIDGSILNGLRILVVDDNEFNRIVTRDSLQSKAQVEIDEAHNGKEAIDFLSGKDFDVVLMDVQMPVMDGYEATRQIRNPQTAVRNHAIPVIALTASVVRSDLDKCRVAGMNDYVPKPFKTFQLISAIAKATARESHSKSPQRGDLPVRSVTLPQTGKAGGGLVTNLSYLEKFCEGNKKQMQKYITMFLDTAPALIEKINDALVKNDFEEIASQVHGYKTKWIMMGMNETKELALKIERQCRNQPADISVKENIKLLAEQIVEGMEELKAS